MSPRNVSQPPATAAAAPKKKFSFLAEDAVETGLFGDGPATVEGAGFAPFDYNGTVRNPPIVLLIKYARGEGRDRVFEEQPYSIGSGVVIDKKTGKPAEGSVLAKGCNAIVHLMKPLQAALIEAGIPLPASGLGDPEDFIGLDVVLERVPQVKRPNFAKSVGGRGNRPPQAGASEEPEREKTILEIRQVVSAPWVTGEGGAKARPAPARTGRGNGRAAAVAAPEPEGDDEDEATPAPAAKARPNGKAAAAIPVTGDLNEEAVEAIMSHVEQGDVPTTRLEALLEESLKDHPQAPAIIDLAVSRRFLMKELGWRVSKDGKTLTAALPAE